MTRKLIFFCGGNFLLITYFSWAVPKVISTYNNIKPALNTFAQLAGIALP